ncbi:MAG: lysophospholipid acyltransferase family protein [Gemmatimonadetes bacterium]|nr:lysophospholipid acyltransferase family protein [Gemmatimonadota bacterium]
MSAREAGPDAGPSADGAPRAPQAVREPLPWKLRVGVALGRWLVRLLGATWRVRVIDREAHDALRQARTPFIFSIWHGELLPCLWAHRAQGIAVLISEHRDGEIIAQVAEGLGYAPSVRGSSSRGAARALLTVVRTLGSGVTVGFTPDGPRGPAQRAAPGAIAAAQRAQAPIIPLRAHASSAWRLRSWDRFMIPKPFARVTFAYGAPLMVAPGAAALEAGPALLEAVMAEIGRKADHAD